MSQAATVVEYMESGALSTKVFYKPSEHRQDVWI